MLKKLTKLLNASIAVAILLIILGFVLVLFPETSLEVFSYLISVILIMNGIYFIILEIKARETYILIDTLVIGILSLLFGIIILFYPDMLQIMIPTILGTCFILNSIFKLRLVFFLRKIEESSWILTLIMTILSVICGVVLIIDPISSSITLTLVTGIMIIVYSISDMIDVILFKRNLKKLVKYLQKNIKIIEE